MNERELGRELLRWSAHEEPAPPPDPRLLTQKVLRRDRLKVRLLAGLTALLWILAATGIFAIIDLYFLYIEPKLLWMVRNPEKVTADLNRVWVQVAEIFLIILAASFAALLLAALCTIFLVFVSRRATLRQVNASLVQISEQLKQLSK